jgi:hypothetical protein
MEGGDGVKGWTEDREVWRFLVLGPLGEALARFRLWKISGFISLAAEAFPTGEIWRRSHS